jgi:hypothetical protein
LRETVSKGALEGLLCRPESRERRGAQDPSRAAGVERERCGTVDDVML